VVDVEAPEGVAIERGEQPLQPVFGAGRRPQADVDVAQVAHVLLIRWKLNSRQPVNTSTATTSSP
jgi:hypothetical protein